MGAVRIVILIVAAAAAIGLALIVRHMAGAHPVVAAARAAAPTVQVLTARRDLPVGTHIASSDLVWRAFPPDAVGAAWITNGPASSHGPHLGPSPAHADVPDGDAMQRFAGAYVHEAIFEGEPILERQIVRAGAGGYMSLALQPGMRAVAVPVTAETGVGGFVLPGDHIDVVLTRKTSAAAASGPGGEESAQVAETILSDLRVLGVDQQSQSKPGANAILATSVTLEVPANEVETLLAAKGRGELALDLRSYADASGPAGRGVASASNSVRFIRAGKVSEVSAP